MCYLLLFMPDRRQMEKEVLSLAGESGVKRSVFSECRSFEKILIVYFIYTAVLATARSLDPGRVAVALLIPVSIWALGVTESHYAQKWSGVLREWLCLVFILIGYWQLNWFATAPVVRWQGAWLSWDRLILERLHVRAGLEMFGPAIPFVLEALYLLLYAIPVVCLAALYLHGRRDRVDAFLTTLFLGAFCAYALLPYFPSRSPRLAFPGLDLPHFGEPWRSMNVWLLDHLDISTSVFPSGHVAVAFSAAFGLRRAVPEKAWLWFASFVVAAVVFTATVYGRYHYAADGFSSIGIAIFAWRVSEVIERYA